jgi:hypothetical protein
MTIGNGDWGVGMPQALLLEDFAEHVRNFFGETPYLVGSVLQSKLWRDVDIRVILSDEEYASIGLGNPKEPFNNSKWISLCLAFSALGKQMTGLPIDFQVQQLSYANEQFKGLRSALGLTKMKLVNHE